MPQMKKKEHITLDDLKKAAALPLEDLTKWMAERKLFGFSITADSYDKKLEELERVAKLSPECQSDQTE